MGVGERVGGRGKHKGEKGCGGSSVSRKTDGEGGSWAQNALLFFFLCSCCSAKQGSVAAEAACHSGSQLIRAGAPPPSPPTPPTPPPPTPPRSPPAAICGTPGHADTLWQEPDQTGLLLLPLSYQQNTGRKKNTTFDSLQIVKHRERDDKTSKKWPQVSCSQIRRKQGRWRRSEERRRKYT